jgi:hypothetical protein
MERERKNRIKWEKPIDVDRIIAAVDLPSQNIDKEKLEEELTTSIHTFRIHGALDGFSREEKRLKDLKAIRNAATKLAKALGGENGADIDSDMISGLAIYAQQYARLNGHYPGKLPIQSKEFLGEIHEEYTDFHGTEITRYVTSGAWWLSQWAAMAINDINGSPRQGVDTLGMPFPQTDGKGPTNKSYFVGYELPDIYERFFMRKFGFSRPSVGGEAGGPGLRFVQECLSQFGLEMNPDAIRKAYQRYQDKWDTKHEK